MATQLFLRNSNADCHLGTDNVNLRGSAGGWNSLALSTSRGAGATASAVSSTVTGPTAGIEIIGNSQVNQTEWISPPVSADVTISGTITGNIWAVENSMNANVAINFVVEVIRANATGTRNGNTLVEIARSARVTEVSTSIAVNNFTVTPTSTVVNRGDRIRIRIFGDDAGTMATGFTFNIQYDAASAGVAGDTYITFNETFSFEGAPGGSTIYLTDTASDVSTASVDREAWTSRGAGVQNDVLTTTGGWTAAAQLTDTAGGTVVDWFTKQLTAFTLGGMAQANLRARTASVNDACSLRLEIARVDSDGTNPTVWGTWCLRADIGTGDTTQGSVHFSAEGALTANVSGDDLSISDGQRLRIRVYEDDLNSNPAFASTPLTFYYAGTSGGASGDSYVVFPQTLTEFAPGTAIPPDLLTARHTPRRRLHQRI